MRYTDFEMDRALHLTNDELLVQIGEWLDSQVRYRGAKLPTRRRLMHRAKEWFEEHYEELVRPICESERVKTLARQDVTTHELVVTIAAILDLGSHKLGWPPVTTLTALIMRLGLHKVCSESWDAGHGDSKRPHT